LSFKQPPGYFTSTTLLERCQVTFEQRGYWRSKEKQERIVERGLAWFVEVGNALRRIRDEEFYREAGFDGFVEYLESKPWGIGANAAYKQIQAAEVVAICTTVQTERQARELAPLARRPRGPSPEQPLAQPPSPWHASSVLSNLGVAVRVHSLSADDLGIADLPPHVEIGELVALAPALLAPVAKATWSIQNPVRVAARRYNGATYVTP